MDVGKKRVHKIRSHRSLLKAQVPGNPSPARAAPLQGPRTRWGLGARCSLHQAPAAAHQHPDAEVSVHKACPARERATWGQAAISSFLTSGDMLPGKGPAPARQATTSVRPLALPVRLSFRCLSTPTSGQRGDAALDFQERSPCQSPGRA